MRSLKAWVMCAALGLLPACASGDKDKGEEDVGADEAGEEKAAATKAPPPPAAAEPPATAAPAEPPPAAPIAAQPAPAPAPQNFPGFDGPKVTRYIKTVAVKIHAAPSKESEVVGWVHRGAKVDVVINGDWAKLESGHFVSNKFLTEQSPTGAAPAKAAQ